MDALIRIDALIVDKIYRIRNMYVMLDFDLAELYGVETKVLKQQVRRNIDRFPEDFLFELTKKEWESLRSQFVTLENEGRGKYPKYLPFVFTEQGVAMLSSVLRSKQAIEINIKIMRIFIKMRKLIISHQEILEKIEIMEAENSEQNIQIANIYEIIKELIEPTYKNRKKIGFKRTVDEK